MKMMTLLLLVVPGVANLLSILSKSRWQLVWVKPWLKCKSTKSVYDNITLELKPQDCCNYRKYFCMNS